MDIYWCIHWELWKHSQQTGCVSIAQSWKSLSFCFVTNNAGPTRKWCTRMELAQWALRMLWCEGFWFLDSCDPLLRYDCCNAHYSCVLQVWAASSSALPIMRQYTLARLPCGCPSSSSYPCLGCWISYPPPTQSFSLFIHGEQSSFTDGAMQSAFSPPTIHSTRGMRSGWRGIHFQIQIQKSGLQMKLTKVRWGKCSVNHPPDIFWHLA